MVAWSCHFAERGHPGQEVKGDRLGCGFIPGTPLEGCLEIRRAWASSKVRYIHDGMKLCTRFLERVFLDNSWQPSKYGKNSFSEPSKKVLRTSLLWSYMLLIWIFLLIPGVLLQRPWLLQWGRECHGASLLWMHGQGYRICDRCFHRRDCYLCNHFLLF